MRIKFRAPIALLVIFNCLIISNVGCQTAAFKKPDLGKLAFWKSDKDALSKVPPPPARHFDPAPTDGTRVAANEPSSGSSTRSMDSVNEYKDEIDSLRKQIANTKEKLSEPIRKPYSFDNVASTYEESDNSFSAAPMKKMANDISSGVNEFKNDTSSQFTQAQLDFKEALAGTTEAVKDQVASTAGDLKEASGGWKDFKMPAELSNFSPKKSVDQSLKSVNQSLYDASGKLNSAVAQTKQQFQGGIKKATNAFAAASNDVNQKISNAATTANDFASNAVQKASHKIEQIAKPNFGLNAIAKQAPNADVIAARKELEEAKRQIEALRSQISQSKESSLAQANSGLNQVGNAITNEFQKTASELQSQSNVLANSNGFKSGSGVTPNGQLPASPSNGFQPKTNQFNTQSVAANPLAQTQPPKSQNNSFGSTTRTPVFQGQLKTPQFNSPQSGLASSPPQNVLRSMQNSGTTGSFQPSSNAPNSSKTGAAEQPGTPGSMYEATPFQNYAPAKGSQTGSFNSQAGFASQGTGSQNGVANASLPDNSRVTTASAASDLPAALLGGSSYSPGSTKLR